MSSAVTINIMAVYSFRAKYECWQKLHDFKIGQEKGWEFMLAYVFISLNAPGIKVLRRKMCHGWKNMKDSHLSILQ